MKIAFIGQKGIPAQGAGLERHVEEIATKLCQNGHWVFVYAHDGYTPRSLKKYEGVRIVHLHPFFSKYFHNRKVYDLFAAIHSIFQDYDVIHYHSRDKSYLPFFIKILKGKRAFVTTYHDWNRFSAKRRFFPLWHKKLKEAISLNAADKTIAVSSEIAKDAPKNERQQLSVIPNGIKIKDEYDSSKLDKWNLTRGAYVLSIGNLTREKGIHTLIDAFRNLESKNMTRGKRLVVVDGGMSDEKYLKELKLNAALSSDVIFLDNVSKSILDQLYSNAYLFIESSQIEEISITLLRSMGYGKATLVSNTMANLDMIDRGTGIAFQSGDSFDLENKLVYMINNPVLVREMGERARETAMKRFTWDRIAVKLENLYNQIIREKRNGRFNEV